MHCIDIVQGPAPTDQGNVEAALAKLAPKDRNLLEHPVILCCEGCEKKALADPDKTLAKVKKLKGKATAPASD